MTDVHHEENSTVSSLMAEMIKHINQNGFECVGRMMGPEERTLYPDPSFMETDVYCWDLTSFMQCYDNNLREITQKIVLLDRFPVGTAHVDLRLQYLGVQGTEGHELLAVHYGYNCAGAIGHGIVI